MPLSPQELHARIRKSNEDQCKKFCPLARMKCRQDCINFVAAGEYDKTETSEGYINKSKGFAEAYCANAFINSSV